MLADLRAAGGDLELWDFDGALLRVKLSGRLASDEGFRIQQLARLDALLKQRIDPALGVALG